MSGSNYRDSNDLQDYWDEGHIPAPHTLSGPYPSISGRSSFTPPPEDSNPFRSPPSDLHVTNTTRGAYAPIDPSEATEMRTYADRDNDHYEQMQDTPFVGDHTTLEKQYSSRKKFLFWGVIVVGVLLLIAGVIVAVVISVHHKPHQNTGNSDPSNFPKNSNLHNSFYGIAYTPLGAILPSCGATREAIIEDIQLLSQITTRIRTYGSDCNVTYLILDAIKETKVNVSVYLGIYVDPSDDSTYQRQKQDTQSALQKFGENNVLGLTVGNEIILDACQNVSSTNPNDTVGIQAAQLLKTKVDDVRSMLSNMSLSKKIPVGTSDAGSYFNTVILEAVDYAMANIHPWFASIGPQQGAGWTWEFLQTNDIALASSVPNTPEFFIAETGWPTNSSTVQDQTNGAGAQANVSNLQIYLDNFVCQANQNNTGYFFFEFMDEPWKLVKYPGVEGYWGLFNSNKQLKSINIPSCSHN